MMDEAVSRVLDVYDQRIEAEARRRTRASRDERLLAVGRAVGVMLNLLIKETEAKAILEIGTSYGYSTIWLAEAAKAIGGKVTTVELHRYKQDYAREALAEAGLGGHVEFRSGDAIDILATLPGPFDFVLIDLWKDLYIPCLELVYPKLAPGALIAADNMIEPVSSRDDAAAYRRAVRAKAGIQSMLLPVGQGIELSRYLKGLPDHLE
jgi:predicted O-methyltransferase YrrM